MLVAEGLRKKYKQREVVREFGLSLDAGEVVGLLGPNGAGKTTCFYMIVGLVAADAGSIELDGQDITAEPMYQRAKLGVGYLPQEPSVFRKLSVADNIRLVLELREDLDAAGIDRELASLLDELQVTHVADQLGDGIMPGWVSDLREDFFGPIGNEEIDALRVELAAAAAGQIELQKALTDLGSRIAALTVRLNACVQGHDKRIGGKIGA